MLHTSIVCIKVDVHSFIRAGSSHPTFSKSGRRRLVAGVCQLVYLSLDICDGAVKVEVADTTGAMAAFRLLTNMGSRQATLAAKKAWMQWRTAKRLENSSSWKHRGETWSWREEEASSRNQIKLGAWKCLHLAYGKIIKQEIHIITLYFYLIPSAISFALARLWCFWKVWRLPKSVWYADDQSIIQSTPALNAKEWETFFFS